jgi:6-phosphogluconolactonase (cycloisomerase 2 family)
MWLSGTYHDDYHTLVIHAVADDGRLGAAHEWDLGEDAYRPAVDVDSGLDVLYTTEAGRLTAYVIEPDGRLTQTGASNVCLGSEAWVSLPLVAVRGFVFASGFVGADQSVCSWEGPRLAPRANLGLRSSYAVALEPRGAAASSASARTLVAMRMDTPTGQYEVRLFVMGHDGALQMLDAATGTGWVRHLLFHPSGRFLYVSHAKAPGSASLDSLSVYTIDPAGHLGAVETLADGGGGMAVTQPPRVGASTGPAAD